MMKARGMKKIPGQCSIEIDGCIHTFVAHAKSHSRSAEIYGELSKLSAELRSAGHVPRIDLVSSEAVDAEEKADQLCSHSEKLAIAFGLLSTTADTPLRITKNLRVCSDCHQATALLSHHRHREILVRDAHRWHHFKDGQCSCHDYW